VSKYTRIFRSQWIGACRQVFE